MAGLGCCLAETFVALSSGVEELSSALSHPLGTVRYELVFPSWADRTEIVQEIAQEIRNATARLSTHIFDADPRS